MLGQAKHKLISLWYFLSIFWLFFGIKQSFDKHTREKCSLQSMEGWMAITLWLKFCSGIHWILIIYQKVHTHTLAQTGAAVCGREGEGGVASIESPCPSGWIAKFTFIAAQSVNYDNDKDVKTNDRMGTKCDGFMLSACVIDGEGGGSERRGGGAAR